MYGNVVTIKFWLIVNENEQGNIDVSHF